MRGTGAKQVILRGRCCTVEKGNGHFCRVWENSGQKHMLGRCLAPYVPKYLAHNDRRSEMEICGGASGIAAWPAGETL